MCWVLLALQACGFWLHVGGCHHMKPEVARLLWDEAQHGVNCFGFDMKFSSHSVSCWHEDVLRGSQRVSSAYEQIEWRESSVAVDSELISVLFFFPHRTVRLHIVLHWNWGSQLTKHHAGGIFRWVCFYKRSHFQNEKNRVFGAFDLIN